MEFLLMLAMGAANIACFVVGAKVGQAVSNGKKVDVILPNPVKAIQECRAEKEADRKRSKMEAILRNIECYDGTPDGQEDVPQ